MSAVYGRLGGHRFVAQRVRPTSLPSVEVWFGEFRTAQDTPYAALCGASSPPPVVRVAPDLGSLLRALQQAALQGAFWVYTEPEQPTPRACAGPA